MFTICPIINNIPGIDPGFMYTSAFSVLDCFDTEGYGYRINPSGGVEGNVLTLHGTSTLLSPGTYRLGNDILENGTFDFTGGVLIDNFKIEVNSNGEITSKTIC